MAKHTADLSALNALLDNQNIEEGKNLDKLFEIDDANAILKYQQQIMEVCIHTSDVSQQARSFKVVKEWTYLLFEEFFDQGDLEKK